MQEALAIRSPLMILWIKPQEASRMKRRSLKSVMKTRIISIRMVKMTPKMERRTTLGNFARAFLETMKTSLKKVL